jgi:thioredoxin-like negative regulator of GroEL
MKTRLNGIFSLVITGILLTVFFSAFAGCGQSQPTFISFTGNSSQSGKDMRPVIEKLKNKYKGKVIFIDVNMDDRNNKGKVDEYHVTMNPTFIIKNAKGQIRETFMGSAQEDMLSMALDGFISSTKKPASSSTNLMQPGTPVLPGTATQSSSVQTVPTTPTP